MREPVVFLKFSFLVKYQIWAGWAYPIRFAFTEVRLVLFEARRFCVGQITSNANIPVRRDGLSRRGWQGIVDVWLTGY